MRTPAAPLARTAHGTAQLAVLAVLATATLTGCGKPHEKEVVEALNKGVQAMNMKDFPRAKGHLDRAAALRPDDAEVRYYLGFIAMRQDQPKEAADHFVASLRGDATNPKAHLYLARSLELAGDAVGARKALEGLFAIDPGEPQGHMIAARLARKDGDRVAEDKALRAAIAGDPGYAPAYAALSALYVEVGAWQAAREVLEEGQRFAPDRVELLEALGLVWLDLGRPERADEVFRAAAKHPEASYTMHFNHAAALLQRGRRAEASRALQRFLLQGEGVADATRVKVARILLGRIDKAGGKKGG